MRIIRVHNYTRVRRAVGTGIIAICCSKCKIITIIVFQPPVLLVRKEYNPITLACATEQYKNTSRTTRRDAPFTGRAVYLVPRIRMDALQLTCLRPLTCTHTRSHHRRDYIIVDIERTGNPFSRLLQPCCIQFRSVSSISLQLVLQLTRQMMRTFTRSTSENVCSFLLLVRIHVCHLA